MENGGLNFTTEDSPYAKHVLKSLFALDAGKVLNRKDLIGGPSNAEVDHKFGLEPEWMIVVLLALVRQGEITLNLPGVRIDSTNLDEAARMGVETLIKFTAVSRPKPIPEQSLRVLFASLDLPENLVTDPKKLELAPIQNEFWKGEKWLPITFWNNEIKDEEHLAALVYSWGNDVDIFDESGECQFHFAHKDWSVTISENLGLIDIHRVEKEMMKYPTKREA
jgi:hypothetical protein